MRPLPIFRFPVRKLTRRLALLSLLVAVWGTLGALPPARGQTGDETGAAEVAGLFNDFLHYARLGKFDEAEAFGEKLLQHPDLDPIQLVTLADADPQSIPTLITLIQHTSIADPAQRILDVIREGEFQQRQDPARIAENVEKLGGSPQMEFNAIARLKESGEYAIPRMIATLQDPAKSRLTLRIVRALPQIGKPAVSPLVVALKVEDPEIRRYIVGALGEIGYPQAAPYLLRLLGSDGLPEDLRQAASEALDRIHDTSDRDRPASAVAGFLKLADQYYREHGSVRADPRLSTANVWYWENGGLRAIQVPTEIYGSVMAMRVCEAVLNLDPSNRQALALWLAADFRREARLGMDVESDEADAGADADATRPEDFPRSLYFARAAGPEYCHLVLGRALRDGDKPVALGAIAALDVVAGASSLVGPEDYKQPLALALRFPDAEVRIKAAIALARALPKQQFVGADIVGQVLAEALRQGGQDQYVVVCGEVENLNRVAGELRDLGAAVVAETNLLTAMDRARRELPGITGFVLATDIESPPVNNAVARLRGEFRFARTPIVILVKDGEEYRAELASVGATGIAKAAFNESGEGIRRKLEALAKKDGAGPLDPEQALQLALRATEALRLVAVDGRTVIDARPTLDALIEALGSQEQALQIAAARVLALMPSGAGQQATCDLALNEKNEANLRKAAFNALAESAKRQGNLLTDPQVTGVVHVAKEADDLTLRNAASQALGALNLHRGEASEIVRSYHRG